jgi:hypothetical protein
MRKVPARLPPAAGWLGDPNEILTGRVIRYAPRTRCTAARNYARDSDNQSNGLRLFGRTVRRTRRVQRRDQIQRLLIHNRIDSLK